jgi:hypothetical protein
MVNVIYSASSWSSLKFMLAFANVHHVLLQHFDFLLRPCHAFPGSGLGGYMKILFQPSLVHYIYIYMCVCIFFWLINFYL